MQLLCGNTNLRPKAKFKTIRKPGACIYIYRSAVYLVLEFFRIAVIVCYDCLRMSGSMRIDMCDFLIHIVHNLNRDNQV